MPDNLTLWNAVDDIDPKFTKKITGKPYQGTSPNPQYLIKLATAQFGPVGKGFGWRVIEDKFVPLETAVMHHVRIAFWWRDDEGTHEFEEYGGTIASRETNAGKAMVDEDVGKKSLTDAIVKALSHLGFAANIFLGRWDDQKYVAEVNAEYRAAEREPAPALPNGMTLEMVERDYGLAIEGAGVLATLRITGKAVAADAYLDRAAKERLNEKYKARYHELAKNDPQAPHPVEGQAA